EEVSWNDAQEFCRKAGGGLRLPSEAEWEYACRAGSTTRWCFGDSENTLREYAWYGDNSGKRTHEVGRNKPNAWGLYDMHGNVAEWCQDWYGEEYYSDCMNGATDPKGPPGGKCRVFRGGSWFEDAGHTRSAFRSRLKPGDAYYCFGLRVVVAAGAVRLLDEVLDETKFETGNPEFDKALDDIKFENAPTLGPIARKCFVATFKNDWEKLWDMVPKEVHEPMEEMWKSLKENPLDNVFPLAKLAKEAGSAKEFYVKMRKEDQKSEEEWVKEITEDADMFEVVGEEFSEDGKTGWIKAKNLKTGKEEKMFRLVKEGDEWKIG
ncbi:MAG: SUMF1/EgtB/PvdO family nonheme iron enzyme, partial [Planctomycetota bacterium]